MPRAIVRSSLVFPLRHDDPVAATTRTICWTGICEMMEYLAEVVASQGFIVYAMTPNHHLKNNPKWTSAHKTGIAFRFILPFLPLGEEPQTGGDCLKRHVPPLFLERGLGEDFSYLKSLSVSL